AVADDTVWVIAATVDGSEIVVPSALPFQFLPTVLPKLESEISFAADWPNGLLTSAVVTVVKADVPVDCSVSGACANAASSPAFCVIVPMFAPRLDPGTNMSMTL